MRSRAHDHAARDVAITGSWEEQAGPSPGAFGGRTDLPAPRPQTSGSRVGRGEGSVVLSQQVCDDLPQRQMGPSPFTEEGAGAEEAHAICEDTQLRSGGPAESTPSSAPLASFPAWAGRAETRQGLGASPAQKPLLPSSLSPPLADPRRILPP